MQQSPVYAKALRRAARRIGGRDPLALHLQASRAELDAWIDGSVAAPELYFVRTVDVLLANSKELSELRGRAEQRAEWFHFDVAKRLAYLRDELLPLPLTEWAVLESLAARFGRVVSRPQIRSDVHLWSGGELGVAVQMYVFRLRLKLQASNIAIQTVRPGGYVLEAFQ